MLQNVEPYRGRERRHHRVFVTRNSEYHCRDGTCVAVRDRRTGQFVPEHAAIGRRMTGGIRFDEEGRLVSLSQPGEVPHPGEYLFFSAGRIDEDLHTSAFVRLERPRKSDVEHYHVV